MNKQYNIVLIGVSAGGNNILDGLFGGFHKHFPLPVVVVLHSLHELGSAFMDRLNSKSELLVKEAESGEYIAPGNIYLAPPNYHLLVEPNKTFSLSIDPQVNYSRPSIDVLFESAIYAYGNSIIGVVLTGANSDGKAGARSIKAAGGMLVVQDPATAEFPTMPQAVMNACDVDIITTYENIPACISRIVNFSDIEKQIGEL